MAQVVITAEKVIRGSSATLELGESESTAYRGDRGKIAYDHSQMQHAPLDAEPNNISDTNATELTDGGDTTLHYHSSDRNRANHSGTQTADTISDLQEFMRDKIPFAGTCATSSSTVAKTAVIGDGTRLPKAGEFYLVTFTSGNSASSVTLSINGDSARNIRLGGGNVSTTTFTLAANSVVMLFFDGTYYNIMGSQRTTDSDTYDRMSWGATAIAGDTINSYKVVMQGLDGRFYPLTLETGTGTTKTVSTVEFQIGSPILYYGTTTVVAANASFTTLYTEISTGYFGYTANLASWVVQKPFYLKGKITPAGNFTLDNTTYTSWLTQSLPTTEDGFVYILLGYAYGTVALKLFSNHPMYEFRNGMVVPYTGLADVVDTKAPLDSPALTGTPTTPTPNGTDVGQIANVQYVQDAVSSAGGGDMMKAIYDTDGDGVVDKSEQLAYDADIFTQVVTSASNGTKHFEVLSKNGTIILQGKTNTYMAKNCWYDADNSRWLKLIDNAESTLVSADGVFYRASATSGSTTVAIVWDICNAVKLSSIQTSLEPASTYSYGTNPQIVVDTFLDGRKRTTTIYDKVILEYFDGKNKYTGFDLNLVSNSSFESGSITDWSPSSACQTISSAYAHSGAYSLRTLAPTGGYQPCWKRVPVTAGHKIYMSAYTKIVGMTSGNQFYHLIQGRNASDGDTGITYCGIFNGVQDWTKSSLLYTVPAGTTSIIVYIADFNLADSSLQAYTDDILVLDMSVVFGVGYEPTQAWCDKNLIWSDIIEFNY